MLIVFLSVSFNPSSDDDGKKDALEVLAKQVKEDVASVSCTYT